MVTSVVSERVEYRADEQWRCDNNIINASELSSPWVWAHFVTYHAMHHRARKEICRYEDENIYFIRKQHVNSGNYNEHGSNRHAMMNSKMCSAPTGVEHFLEITSYEKLRMGWSQSGTYSTSITTRQI